MKTLIAAILIALVPVAAHAGQSVTYQVDGAGYEGYFAKAGGTAKGLVLIVQDWDGLTGYEKKRAEMLSKLGYDAFALDLFGKGNRPETTDGKRAETGKLYNDREKMLALTLAGLKEARKMSKAPAVVLGYCFGGAAVLEMARSGKAGAVKGYATFHGVLKTPEGESYPKDTPPLLIEHGGADSNVTMDDVVALNGELEAAGVPYEIDIYSGAPHAFTVFGGERYQKRADDKSWAALQSFLKKRLGG